MHNQTSRKVQERATTLSVKDALDAAERFFSDGGVYAAYHEKRGPGYVAMRGQGGEEVVVAARAFEGGGGSVVTASTLLYDQQVARFLASLPYAEVPPVAVAEAGDEATASGGAEGAK